MTKIEVLGPGCYNCHLVEQAAREAVAMAGVQAEIVKITDWGQIASYGILHTPGLVIDGKVKCAGRIPSVDEIKTWIREAGGTQT